jgi:hypothetical protein
MVVIPQMVLRAEGTSLRSEHSSGVTFSRMSLGIRRFPCDTTTTTSITGRRIKVHDLYISRDILRSSFSSSVGGEHYVCTTYHSKGTIGQHTLNSKYPVQFNESISISSLIED